MIHLSRVACVAVLAALLFACVAQPFADGSGDIDEGAQGESQAATSGAFVHPGILVDRGMLDFVKQRAAAGAAPWKAALDRARSDRLGSLSYVPHAFVYVECGPVSMNPSIGCAEEKDDADAAYTHALLWYYTGNEQHAQKAIQIMNAWSSTLKGHTHDNAPLQAAWVAEVFPRAAEIIRYTYSGWATADITRFKNMLWNAYLPLMWNGADSNGNWELSMAEAVINIGIFNDDRKTFDQGVALWRRRVPAYVYLTDDGAKPLQPPWPKSDAELIKFWYNQTTYVNGLSQETCRDLGHVQYGLAAAINAGETARIQGVDLLSERGKRLRAGLEFHAQFLNGAPVPSWLCNGKLKDATPDPMWEIAFNAYANVQHQSLPQTSALLGKIRPTTATHHMAWETLTHGDIGSAGLTAPDSGAASTITSRASGKCLDAAGGGTGDGTKLQIWSCNGSAAQSYRLQDAGGGLVQLVNTGSNKCVDVVAASTADGARIQLFTCNGTDAQKFRRQDAGGGFVSLVNAKSGKCLDVEGRKTADGTSLQQWACGSGTNQQWKVGG